MNLSILIGLTMSLLVQKFGGTSVGSLERIQAIARKIAISYQTGESLVIVVSAMSGETDRLLRLAYQISANPQARTLASLITQGEQTTINALALCLHQLSIPALSLTGTQAGIITDACYLNARIDTIHSETIKRALAQKKVVIVAGFQGVTPTGDITALGRGGSDTTAVALSAVLQARECQIYTDVAGIYSADPRLVAKAYHLPQIALPLMLELASLGAKVLQLRAVELAGKYRVPLRVLSSFHEGVGTLIDYATESALESPVVVGLTHKTSLVQCHLSLIAPSHIASLLQTFASHAICVEHVSQHGTCLTLYMAESSLNLMTKLCDQACQNGQLLAWHSVTGLARLALVGQGVRSQLTIMQQFFTVLETQNLVWHDFYSSELALSILLPEELLAPTAQALHQAFFENQSIVTHPS